MERLPLGYSGFMGVKVSTSEYCCASDDEPVDVIFSWNGNRVANIDPFSSRAVASLTLFTRRSLFVRICPVRTSTYEVIERALMRLKSRASATGIMKK